MKQIHKFILPFALVLALISMIVAFTTAGLAADQRANSDDVFVPAGQFLMGCTLDFTSITCDGDARPIHAVYLDAFYIDRTEVTNAQYAACVAAGRCLEPQGVDSETRPDYYANPTYANYPMLNVNWGQANAYCQWEGKRLPTEAEWEKAARGTDLRWFPWGNEPPTCQRLNFAAYHPNGPKPCVGDTVAVGSYPTGASPYGALDMTGNVREWVKDLYDTEYYKGTPYYNPQGPVSNSSGEHLVRGGSWADDVNLGANTWVRLDGSEIYKMHLIGFRCAKGMMALPTPTPIPTLTPTPLPPDASRVIGSEGGVLWQAYPGHLTVMNISPQTMIASTTVTIHYDVRPDNQGELQGFDHFFFVSMNPVGNLSKPVSVTLAYANNPPLIKGSIGLYRLEAGVWVTNGITLTVASSNTMLALANQTGPLTGSMSNAVLALIDRVGSYGLLGRTHRVYLPMVLHEP